MNYVLIQHVINLFKNLKERIQNGKNIKLAKMLIQLASPYKKTKAYETFKNLKPNKDNSGFWKTDVSYIVKYENADLKKS